VKTAKANRLYETNRDLTSQWEKRFLNARSTSRAPPGHSCKVRKLWPGVALLFSAGSLYAQTIGNGVGGGNTPVAALSAGERIAHEVCAACHLFPEPDVTDKKTWKEEILPRMETRLGVSPPDYDKSPEGELLKRLKLYPDAPLVSKVDWQAIVEYYLARAPAIALPQDARPEIQIGLHQFTVTPARFRYAPPSTSLVQISPSSHRVFVGDDRAKSIAILSPGGELLDSVWVDNVPVSIVETAQGIYVTAIGSFQPSEVQKGSLLFFPKKRVRGLIL
jgi:hypothetical protein